VDTNPIGSLNNDGHNYFVSQNPYTLNSYATFGEMYYNITPDLKLTTGLRWTIDEKHFVDIPSQLLTNGYGFSVTNIENQTWERPTGRAVLDWSPKLDFTDQTLLYASYSHGYKAGGANPPGAQFLEYGGADSVGSVIHPLTFKPEYIEAFELGAKNTLLDGSLTLNGDVFYYNYTGYQISEIVDRTALNNNYNAHVEGAEVTANYEPLPGLKFNFAGGWEDTAAAGGDSGIDLMDRTAGAPGWMVVKPFPTEASNCILPDYVVAAILQQQAILPNGNSYGGVAGYACNVAYTFHLDPVTQLPYQANPSGLSAGGPGNTSIPTPIPSNYPGFNPSNPLINNGEGFSKNLAGNKLPNAPPFTVSFGSEYTMPITTDWAATLRGDFYWQADSWARIFNDRPYDEIHGYSTANLALILTSTSGWQVMGYVKNVFNVTAITGDFLNSDDSGLTTNVFLTDPRLFGVRVTKDFSGGEGDYGVPDFFTNLFSDTDGGRPILWIDLGGQIEGISGQGSNFLPPFLSAFSTSSVLQEKITPQKAMNPPPLSFGDEASISFQPEASDWVFSASVRYGRSGNKMDVHHQTNGTRPSKIINGVAPSTANIFSQEKFVDTHVYHAESHSIMDFMAGKDVGLGLFGEDLSTVLSGGIRIAQFVCTSNRNTLRVPSIRTLISIPTTPTKTPRASSRAWDPQFRGGVLFRFWAATRRADSMSTGASTRPFCSAGRRRSCGTRKPAAIKAESAILATTTARSISILLPVTPLRATTRTAPSSCPISAALLACPIATKTPRSAWVIAGISSSALWMEVSTAANPKRWVSSVPL
jgi:iron complex outermembrane receptor protein